MRRRGRDDSHPPLFPDAMDPQLARMVGISDGSTEGPLGPGGQRPEGVASSPAGRLAGRLVERAREGDRAAFAGLVRMHRGEVQRVARRLIGNHEDAEDVAQEAFVRAWKGLALFRDGQRFGAWVVGIAVHLVRDLQRSRGRRAEAQAVEVLEDLMASRAQDPSREGSSRELQQLAEAAVASLPDRLRVAVVLRTLEGHGYGEIARITGVQEQTVRMRVAEGRKALRRALAPHVDGDEVNR